MIFKEIDSLDPLLRIIDVSVKEGENGADIFFTGKLPKVYDQHPGDDMAYVYNVSTEENGPREFRVRVKYRHMQVEPSMPKVKDPKPETRSDYGKHIDITDEQLNPSLPRKEEYETFKAGLDKAYRASGLGVDDFFASKDMFEALKGQTMDLYDSGYATRKEVISIQPGDVVVCKCTAPLTLKESDRIKIDLRRAFPNTKSVFLGESMSLEVYREQDLKMVDGKPIDIEQAKRAFKPHPEDREQVKE
jgi:hypothetical protein